jgi:Tfp pilus assembly protein PilO
MSRLPVIRLTARDRRALGAGIAAGLILLVLFAWILPTLERMRRLDRAVASERQRLQEVRRLHAALGELGEREARIQERLKRRASEAFSVAAVIEAMARESRIMEQVQYLKPEQAKVSDQYREASVSLKAVELSAEQLVDFLYRVESSDRILRVRNLQIRNHPKEAGKLDVTLTIFTLLPASAPLKPTDLEPPPPETPAPLKPTDVVPPPPEAPEGLRPAPPGPTP